MTIIDKDCSEYKLNDVSDFKLRPLSPARISARERRLAAMHEAGHVVVAEHIRHDRQQQALATHSAGGKLDMRVFAAKATARIFRNTAVKDHRSEKSWLGQASCVSKFLTPFERRMVACAGYAAELAWTGDEFDEAYWWDPEAMSATDWELAECEPGDPDDLCGSAIIELEKLLSRGGPLWSELIVEARYLIEDERAESIGSTISKALI
jgi:hypothetical protein